MFKKITIFILALAVIAGCNREEIDQPVDNNKDYPEFTASMEQIGENTKTALDPNLNILWQKGDMVFLYCKRMEADIYELDTGEGNTHGIFKLTYIRPSSEVSPINHFVAISPASAQTEISSIEVNGDTYTFNDYVLPDVQKYVKDSYDPAAFPMIAISDTEMLPFKNAAGILKLKIKGTAVVKSIMLSTSKTITGKTKITTGAVLTLTGEEGKNSIMMDCGQAGVPLNETTVTTFHFVLPPVDLSDGFTVEIVDNANGHMVMKAPAGLKQNKIERNHVLTMPEISYKAISAAPVPAANEIVVRMADPKGTPTGVNDDPYNNHTPDFQIKQIDGAYWKYVHENGPLTEIPYKLFAPRNVNFEEMILPEGLVTIKDGAFWDDDVNDGNYHLKKIVLPTTLKTIESGAFRNCKALEEIVFNDPERSQLDRIASDAFRKCLALRSVVLPNNPAVKSFVFGGFWDCANLTSINIPDNTKTILGSALRGTSLKTLTIPAGVTSLGINAFDGMTKLETAVIPEGVTVIPESLFAGCSQLTSLILPSTVKTLGSCFIYGTKITSLELPEGLEEIVTNAFYESKFTSFTIPSSVKTIGASAIQSTADEFTVTVKAPKSVNLEGWDKDFVEGAYNCNLILHSSRKNEVTGSKWRESKWDYKSITFIDDSGNVVKP